MSIQIANERKNISLTFWLTFFLSFTTALASVSAVDASTGKWEYI